MMQKDINLKINCVKERTANMRRLLNTIFVLSLGLFFAIAAINCGGRSKKEETRVPHTVAVMSVEQKTVNRSIELFGSIYGDLQVTVTPKITGRVTQIVKPEGSKVNVNDTILYILNDIPGMDYKPGPVLSPIQGTVGKIFVEVGQAVAQITPIATVASYSQNVRVKAPIPDQDLAYVKKGAQALVSVASIANGTFEGIVTNVSTVVDQMSGSATVEITIPNQDSKLIPGMSASVNLLLEQKDNVIALPLVALFTDGFSKVMIVDNNNTARFREIKIGLVGNDLVEVKSGLSIGEKVITTGKERVSDGDVVTIAGEK
jgi:multidrug efflux pump subunit AcrA (membrane-fusion protein)